jgi:hypothetical protein
MKLTPCDTNESIRDDRRHEQKYGFAQRAPWTNFLNDKGLTAKYLINHPNDLRDAEGRKVIEPVWTSKEFSDIENLDGRPGQLWAGFYDDQPITRS